MEECKTMATFRLLLQLGGYDMQDHKPNKLILIGQMSGYQHDNVVYDRGGCSPTIIAQGGKPNIIKRWKRKSKSKDH